MFGVAEAADHIPAGSHSFCRMRPVRCAATSVSSVMTEEGERMPVLFELGAGRAADALRKGEQTAKALAEALLARCAASPLNAFISLEADRLRAAARAADERRRRGERLGPL